MFLNRIGLWRKRHEKNKGLHDKQQMTAVFAAAMIGEFLPPQLVYKRTKYVCLPT